MEMRRHWASQLFEVTDLSWWFQQTTYKNYYKHLHSGSLVVDLRATSFSFWVGVVGAALCKAKGCKLSPWNAGQQHGSEGAASECIPLAFPSLQRVQLGWCGVICLAPSVSACIANSSWQDLILIFLNATSCLPAGLLLIADIWLRPLSLFSVAAS